MSRRVFSILTLIVAFALEARAGEPIFMLSEDGTSFVYRSQPGDQPAAVAARFGVGREGLDAFLAANGITDATRVAVGHVYRVPNPLAARTTEAEARATALADEAAAARAEASTLRTESAANAARLNELERRAADLERLARRWPWIKLLGLALVLALAAMGFLTHRSVGELRDVEREAKRLGDELDERRRAALADRQQSARRIMDLEESVRALEQELALRPSIRRPTGTH
jgi:hypothetical protein